MERSRKCIHRRASRFSDGHSHVPHRHNGDFSLRSLMQILIESSSDSFTDLPICTCFLLSWARGLTVCCSTPTIVSALGYSPSRTQLLTVQSSQSPSGRVVFIRHSQVPPYACSFIFSIISSYFCDKYKSRGLVATFCALLAAAGYAIFLGEWFTCPVIDATTSEPMYICSCI